MLWLYADFCRSSPHRTSAASRAQALSGFLLLTLQETAETAVVGSHCTYRKGHFGGGAICRNSNILCLLLSHLHLAQEVSPQQVGYETEPSQHCNINIRMIKLPPHNVCFYIGPSSLIFYNYVMVQKHRDVNIEEKKNQRTWFHFTPKCNLLKGLGRVILLERKF